MDAHDSIRDFLSSLRNERDSTRGTVRKFLRTAEADPQCDKVTLEVYLLKPILQVAAYIRQLQRLIFYTPENHPGFGPANTTLAIFTRFCTKKNIDVWLADRQIADVNLDFHIRRPFGLPNTGHTLVFEGDLSFQSAPTASASTVSSSSSSSSNQWKEIHAILMKDVLIFTDRDPSASMFGKRMVYNAHIQLNQYLLDASSTSGSMFSLAPQFGLAQPVPYYQFKAGSNKSRGDWMEKLRETFADLASTTAS